MRKSGPLITILAVFQSGYNWKCWKLKIMKWEGGSRNPASGWVVESLVKWLFGIWKGQLSSMLAINYKFHQFATCIIYTSPHPSKVPLLDRLCYFEFQLCIYYYTCLLRNNSTQSAVNFTSCGGLAIAFIYRTEKSKILTQSKCTV